PTPPTHRGGDCGSTSFPPQPFEVRSPKMANDSGQGSQKAPNVNDQAATDFVDFLKDPTAKRRLQDFLVETFKAFEAEKVTRLQARVEHEKAVDDRRIAPHHTSGNVAPILADTFNMFDAEKSFARGLKATKQNLVRAVEDRVEEIN